MKQYKQEYMTELGYVLGTLQERYGNVIDKFPPEISENQTGLKVFNEFVEFLVDKFLVSNERNYEEFIKNNIDRLKKEFTTEKEIDKWKNISNVTAMKHYNELDPIDKLYLAEFNILHSIDSTLGELDVQIKDRLLSIIKNVWLKDENHISESKIADEICEAYESEEISLISLEMTDSRDLLQCVYGYKNFSDYNKNIYDLFEQAIMTDYDMKKENVIFTEQNIIGNCKDIIKFLKKEVEFLEKEGELYETSCRDIKSLIEYMQDYYELENIIGIENNKETGGYKLIEDDEIIETLEYIIENQEENGESL